MTPNFSKLQNRAQPTTPVSMFVWICDLKKEKVIKDRICEQAEIIQFKRAKTKKKKKASWGENYVL